MKKIQPPTNKLVKIKDIGIDEKLYPRAHVNYQTRSRYYNAIQSGAILPPICVAKIENGTKKFSLIDGRHRIEAMTGLGEEYIQAEVYEGLTKKEIFIKAVELNTIHGKPFDAFEVVGITQKLKDDFKMTLEEISAIVRIPVDKIEPFVAKRITRIIETGDPVVLKKPLYDYAGIDISINDNLPQEQKKLDGIAQIKMIEGVITLVRGGYISKVDETVEHRLKKLYKLLKARFEGESNINKLPKPKKDRQKKK